MPTNQRIRSISPINPAVWAFGIGGMVRHPLILSYADLPRFPSVTLPVSIICTERRGIDTAHYTGIPLAAVFELVDLPSGANFAILRGYDGYSTLLPLDVLRDQGVIAYASDGQPLTHEQGAPARLVIPGRYGYKMPKWVSRIEVTDQAVGGTWESRGFDRAGAINQLAEITHHEVLPNGMIRLHGFAYGYPEPVSLITVQVDSAQSMNHFTVDPARTHWQLDWTPPYPNGVFTLYSSAMGQQSRPRGYIIRA